MRCLDVSDSTRLGEVRNALLAKRAKHEEAVSTLNERKPERGHGPMASAALMSHQRSIETLSTLLGELEGS